MNLSLSERAAIQFSTDLYGALALGQSVQQAFEPAIVRWSEQGTRDECNPQLLVRPGVDASRVVLGPQRFERSPQTLDAGPFFVPLPPGKNRTPANEQAWNDFYDRYAPMVRALCRRSGQRDTEDIVQEVFSKLVVGTKAPGHFPSERHFRAWLRTLTHNTMVDSARKRASSRQISHREERSLYSLEAREDVAERLAAEFDLELLAEAKKRVRSRVSPRDWSVYLAVAEDLRTPEDVSRELGITVPVVLLAKSRVIKLLRSEIENQRGSVRQRVKARVRSPEVETKASVLPGCRSVEETDAFRRVMDGLDERHRQIVQWKLRGDTDKEIASRLKCSSPAVAAEWRSIGEKLEQELDRDRRRRASESKRRQDLPKQILRHTDVTFPARVRQGQIHNLRLQIVPAEAVLSTGEYAPLDKPHSHDATLLLKVPRPRKPDRVPVIRVTTSIAAENLEIDGPSRLVLNIPVEGKSRAVIFRLRGARVGHGRIMLDFAQSGRPVGSVDLYPEIVAGDQEELGQLAPSEGNVELRLGQGFAAPDLTIKVFEHRFAGQAGRLHFVVSSALRELDDLPVFEGDFGTIDLKTDVAAWVQDRLDALGALASRADESPESVSRTLSNIGYCLFEQVLPRELQNLYWTIRERNVRSVLVLSDEPHIPWELIKPYRDNPATGKFEDGEFWGESYALTHWLRGRPPAHTFSVNRICALAPGPVLEPSSEATLTLDMVPPARLGAFAASPPEESPAAHPIYADEELAVLRTLEASGSRFQLLPARCSEILKALQDGEFDLLHLVAHGKYAGSSMADASAVLLEDGAFRVGELSPRLAAALQSAAPLIFFNSCHSRRLGFSLTRLGCWGAQLVHLGCGGFIGTLWPVTDRAASDFAQAFYRSMIEGRSIGEAMLRARQRTRECHPNDPTWLAYCCFADPLARIEQPAPRSPQG
jgi:RNA polymerase sigma factor (sigma-70 family)